MDAPVWRFGSPEHDLENSLGKVILEKPINLNLFLPMQGSHLPNIYPKKDQHLPMTPEAQCGNFNANHWTPMPLEQRLGMTCPSPALACQHDVTVPIFRRPPYDGFWAVLVSLRPNTVCYQRGGGGGTSTPWRCPPSMHVVGVPRAAFGWPLLSF